MPDALHVAPEGLEAVHDFVLNCPVPWEDRFSVADGLLAAYHAATAPRWERALEVMRAAAPCREHPESGVAVTCCEWCNACWASMVDAARQEWNRQ